MWFLVFASAKLQLGPCFEDEQERVWGICFSSTSQLGDEVRISKEVREERSQTWSTSPPE